MKSGHGCEHRPLALLIDPRSRMGRVANQAQREKLQAECDHGKSHDCSIVQFVKYWGIREIFQKKKARVQIEFPQ